MIPELIERMQSVHEYAPGEKWPPPFLDPVETRYQRVQRQNFSILRAAWQPPRFNRTTARCEAPAVHRRPFDANELAAIKSAVIAACREWEAVEDERLERRNQHLELHARRARRAWLREQRIRQEHGIRVIDGNASRVKRKRRKRR